ncbi:hypothetical protein OE88DRAFT_727985 [Heliocybe sulcata]|uniref:Uncharacterized protein n=1 Tax=Heliocybe sulcata TaxID=5364 RepID=A0A5C3NJI5_9AGAM|nr:hypothetical protein OE88DRAFT_727985 [Heliocybe sulcata]
MHPSLRAALGHQPLIKFVGKRVWPSSPEPPHAHPFAPKDIKDHFSDFLQRFQSSKSSNPQAHPAAPAGLAPSPKKVAPSGVNVSGVQRYQEFWEAPAQFWNPRVHALEEWEIDAIQTGGASLR